MILYVPHCLCWLFYFQNMIAFLFEKLSCAVEIFIWSDAVDFLTKLLGMPYSVVTAQQACSSEMVKHLHDHFTKTDINPFRLSYVYIRTKFPNRCDSCTYIIYVHGLCDQNMGLLTDTLRYHHTVHTRCSRASGLQPAAILQHIYQRKKSGVYSELSAVFGKFWKITIVGPSSIHRLVWNTTAHYMDFLPWKWS